MTATRAWDPDAGSLIIDELKGLQGATLPILHALQEEFGYIHEASIPLIARALNLSRADVHGVVTFYHDFRSNLPGKHVVKLCRAEACQAMGCEGLVTHLKNEHGVLVDATTADGHLTVETIYCLGNCALGPAALVDGALIGRVDAGLLDDICSGRDNERLHTDLAGANHR